MKPVYTLNQIITQLTTSWGGGDTNTRTWYTGNSPDGAGTTITYAINVTPTNGSGTSYEISGLASMDAVEQAAARLAFELWDDVIAPTLQQTSSGSADITLDKTTKTHSNGTYTDAWASTLSGTDYHLSAGQVWIASSWFNDASFSNSGYGLITYEHEIGHALGLSHPGTYDASQGNPTYANDAVYAQDNRQYTIMSYFGGYAPGSGWQQDGTYSNWYYPQTPMVDDIAALQAKYGADLTTRTGNTTYGFHSSFAAGDPERAIFDFSANPHPIFAIWDAGGNDTLDASGYVGNQTIDLTPGNYSSVDGMVGNVGIAFNCIIENAIGGTGNDVIIGNSADNTLNGGTGADSLAGGIGNDIYIVSDTRAVVIENPGEGTWDVVYAAVDYTTPANVEALVMTGNGLHGYGNSGDNYLTAVGNNDVLLGGPGNDTYNITVSSTQVVENPGEGTWDVVYASVNYTTPANVEALVMIGDGLHGYGNSGDNYLTAAGNNDILAGGPGNDRYNITVGSTQVIENPGEGNFDVVFLGVDYTMPANVEVMAVTGNGVHGYGNAADNIFYAYGTNDILAGGTGNDAYYITVPSTQVIENAGQGSWDVVYNYVDYTDPANIEAIFAAGNGVHAYGTTGDNYLSAIGNNDILVGGAGNDTYSISVTSTQVVENAGEGSWDVVYNSVDYTMPANVEAMVVTGNGVHGYGNSGDNYLTAIGNNDILAGGAGNDIYNVTVASTQVVENPGQGAWDVIYASVDYTLSANVEAMVMVGNGLHGTGNADNNYLYSNGLSNTLTGGGGSDTFTFQANFGQQTITDFTAADHIDLHQSFSDYSHLIAAATQTGNDVTIQDGGHDTLTLLQVHLQDLQSSNFLFV